MEQSQQRQEDRVAPILPTEKRQYFLLNVIQTVLGISFMNENKFLCFALYICPPIIIIIISTQIQNYMIASILSSLLPSVVVIIIKILKNCVKKNQEQQQLEKSESLLTNFLSICILVAYSYLAHNHFYHLSSNQQINIIGISFITLITSMYSLHSKSFKQFGMLTHQYNQITWKSTAMIRPLLCFLFLIPQTVLFLINDKSGALPVLEIIYSFLWLSWMAGLVTNIKYTFQFICEVINSIIFGEQTKQTFTRKIISLFLNLIIVFGIQTQSLTSNYFIVTNSIIIVTSFVSSTFLMTICIRKAENQFSVQKQTNYYEIAYQLLLVFIKVLFSLFVQPTDTTIIIILIIDIGIYVFAIFLIDLNKARNHFGYANCFHNEKLEPILRAIIRLTIDISITILACAAFNSEYFTNMFWSALVLRIIVYRSYKRAIFKPLDLQIHLSFLIGLIFMNSLQVFLVPLLMLPLPQNFYLYLVASFVIPKKNIHKNQKYFRIIYITTTFILIFLYFFTFGILEMTMIFGLPIFLWSIPQFNEIQYSANGKQKFIYLNLVKTLPPVVKNLQKGTYLIRISKYLTICRVLQRGIGYQVVQFRGLESQQITSCHNIQSQTIDNMIEQIWGDNKKQWSLDFLNTVLRPISKKTHHLFQENQIKLTGIIQSQDFITLLKNNFLKIILYYLKNSQFSVKQLQQMKKIKSELKLMISSDQAFKIYPSDFAKLLGITQTAQKKEFSQKIIAKEQPKITAFKEKLPPIQKPKLKVFEDLDFMVEQSPINKNSKNQKKTFQKQISIPKVNEKDIEMASKQQLFEKKIHPQTHKQLFDSQTEDHLNSGPPLTQPCYYQLSVIFYILCLGKNKFLDQKKLFDIIKNEQSAQKILKNIEFDGKGKLGLKSLRAAFKISIDKYINGDYSLQVADIQDHLENQYIGILQEKQFKEAISQLKRDIWVLNYKQQINIHRYHERPVDLYLFELEESIVKSIWNNLRFQLLYATNDDDQRYSIQTHPNFLRNILIESAIEPLGYAPFYSGLLVL